MTYLEKMSQELTKLKIPHQCYATDDPEFEDDEIVINASDLTIQVPNALTPISIASYSLSRLNDEKIYDLLNSKEPTLIANRVKSWLNNKLLRRTS